MGQALYRKYRSKNLSEIVGQEHITNALQMALKSGRISHAYLFTGPRGIGKTSIARILAHEANKLPYDETAAAHLDIIEIDAASNRRIDEVRDLREKVHITPTSAKYKVYIIDEVHMLTKEAFNALLKTLEEPPAHVIFILATTEAHKLPETIISRTQHFTFKPIEQSQVVAHLKDIAKQESITIDDEALALIAKHGGGSFRDSISLLDQIRNSADKVTSTDVQAMLGITPETTVSAIVDALETTDAKTLIALLQDLRSQGIEPAIFTKQLAAQLRANVLEGKASHPQKSLQLLEKLIEIPTSADPHASLEVILLSAVLLEASGPTTPIPQVPTSKPPENEQKKTKSASETAVKPPEKHTPATAAKSQALQPTEPQKASSEIVDETAWPEIVSEIKQRYNTLYGVLRMAQPTFSGNTVTLALKFTFHQKRLNEPRNKQILADAIQKICGATPEIICIVSETTDQSTPPLSKESESKVVSENPIGTISNIFGGAELLES